VFAAAPVVTAKGSVTVHMVTCQVWVVTLVAGAVPVIATVSPLLTTEVEIPVLTPFMINTPNVVVIAT